MPTYCDMVQAAALGAAAADTFTAVGTVTMRPGPGVILGVIVNGTANANTATEAYQTQFNFDFSQCGYGDFLIQGPCNVGEGIATQSGGFAGAARLVGCAIPFRGNEQIPITAGHHGPAPTAGLNAQAAILYSQPPHPPAEWFARFPEIYAAMGADSEANAAVTADAAITDLNVPSWANHICGFACGAAQDAAPRTAEDIVVAVTMTSTMKDFTPQEYPFLWKYPNLAGTLVGKGISLPTVTFPAWIPTGGVNQTITPTVDLMTGVTDAHSVAFDVLYTEK